MSPTGAELKGKKAVYERLNSIYVYQKTPQLTTIVDVEKAQADYERLQASALAELEKAEADYSSLQAQYNVLLLQIKFLTLKAPFAGVIVSRYADKGALIQNGMNNANTLPVFELQDLQTIRVQVDVPETNVALIGKQSKADITFPELPETHYSAILSRMAYGLNESTKTMKVEIDLPNPDFKLRSGMYAKVEMQDSQRKTVLAVPNEAIGNIKGQSFVYVVNNNTVNKVEVKTGLRDEHSTELLKMAMHFTPLATRYSVSSWQTTASFHHERSIRARLRNSSLGLSASARVTSTSAGFAGRRVSDVLTAERASRLG